MAPGRGSEGWVVFFDWSGGCGSLLFHFFGGYFKFCGVVSGGCLKVCLLFVSVDHAAQIGSREPPSRGAEVEVHEKSNTKFEDLIMSRLTAFKNKTKKTLPSLTCVVFLKVVGIDISTVEAVEENIRMSKAINMDDQNLLKKSVSEKGMKELASSEHHFGPVTKAATS
ncbi:hypothetical protein LOAG_00308 [Loa loa]|uniref:Uncharacterized protein n=1 Tax=Loa loa TaxID=7209 RepID=A0A1S0UDM0_LOALO|nr:hypothetical protein LOAG_00308 [Loa loa]EFO28175.1 hypothetical protein LOAG_00308 [Loa loa]